MTTDDQAREWGRRAMALGFVWAPGCLTMKGERIGQAWYQRPGERGTVRDLRALPSDAVVYAWHMAGDIDTAETTTAELGEPDFRCAATAGVLVAWVRGLCDDPALGAVCTFKRDRWYVVRAPEEFRHGWDHLVNVGDGPTEVAAWLAAAEAKGAQ